MELNKFGCELSESALGNLRTAVLTVLAVAGASTVFLSASSRALAGDLNTVFVNGTRNTTPILTADEHGNFPAITVTAERPDRSSREDDDWRVWLSGRMSSFSGGWHWDGTSSASALLAGSENYSGLGDKYDATRGGCSTGSGVSGGTERGNPINFATGAKIEEELDVFSADTEMAFDFRRVYNSNRNQPGGYYDSSGFFGSVWKSNLEEVFYQNSTNELSIEDWNRTIRYFTRISGTNKFISSDSTDYFISESNGDYSAYLSGGIVKKYKRYSSYINGMLHYHYRLSGVYNKRNVGWTIEYGQYGTATRIARVVHSSGRQASFTWSGGVVSQITDSGGGAHKYYYDTNPNGQPRLVWVERPDGKIVRYVYSGMNLVGKEINYISHSTYAYSDISWQFYDSSNNTYPTETRTLAVSTQHAGGNDKYSFQYVLDTSASLGEILSVVETNPLGKNTTYEFESGKLKRVTGSPTASCLAGMKEITYDQYGRKDLVVRQDGVAIDYDYNQIGQMTRKIVAAGTASAQTTTYTWDPSTGLLLQVDEPGGLRTNLSYDEYEQVTSITETNMSPNGVVGQARSTNFSYTYHPNGLLASRRIDGPISGAVDAVTYVYDAQSQLTYVENGLGHRVTYSNYSGLGLPGRVVGANGETTDFSYDAVGRVTSVTSYVAGQPSTASYVYSTNGLLSSRSNPDGTVESYEYDAVRRPSAVVRSMGGTAFERLEYTYNLMSQVVETRTYSVNGGVKTLSGVSKVEYDELGRVKAKVGLNGQDFRYAYDANDRLVQSIDSLGRSTSYAYNDLDQLTTQTDTLGNITRFEYDQAGRLNKVIDPRGLATTYVYDGFGQLWAQHSLDTGTTSFQYSSAGLRTLATRNDGSALSYTYDDAGRLTWYGTAMQGRSYSYDWCQSGIGRLCAAAYNGGTRQYAYTPFGQLQGTLDWTPSSSDWTGYSYDLPGRLTGISYPSGVSIGYGYSAGKLTTMVATMPNGSTQTVASNISYLPLGGFKSWTYGNGLTRNHYYDQNLVPGDLRLTGLTTMDGAATVQSMLLQYNSNNEITKITNFTNQNLTQDYTYDAVGRLTRMTFASGGQDFTFDANGNRTSHKWHPGWPNVTPEGYAVDTTSNRVLNTHLNYTYDARGNRATQSWNGSTATYSYDAFNRLKQVSRNVASTWMNPNYVTTTYPAGATDYVVNALDQRVSKSGPLGTSRYVYTGQNTLLAEHTNGAWSSYLWLGGQPVGLVRNNTLYWVHNDHLGRPEMVTNAAKQRVWWANNYAYDRSIAVDSIGGLNLGLPGQYYDAESGHWYNGFRDYDSRLGAYIQSDPVGLQGGLNTYSYVKNSPVNSVDPLGLFGVQARRFRGGEYNGQVRFAITFYSPTSGVLRDGKGAMIRALRSTPIRKFNDGLEYLQGGKSGVSSMPISQRRACDKFDEQAENIYVSMFGRWKPESTISMEQLYRFVGAVNTANGDLRYDADVIISETTSALPPFQ